MAFFLMVIVSYFSVSSIVHNHILSNVRELFLVAETNIRESLREPDVTLANSSFTIRRMIENGDSREKIHQYMIDLTNWLFENKDRVLGFNGLYGLILGDFLDGTRAELPGIYRGENHFLFGANRQANGKVLMSVPRIEPRTRSVIASFSQEIFDAEKNFLGMLVIDVYLTRLLEYVSSLRAAEGAYGVILNQNFEIIAHENANLLGTSLRRVGYADVVTELESAGEVFNRQIVDSNGQQAAVFFRKIYNGWYVGMITPLYSFYRDVRYIALVLSVLGIAMMSILGGILLRLSAAKIRSDEENRSKSAFLARMSHEIRTPMNAIIGMSELALRSDKLASMAECVVNIRQAGHNLLSIINDILDFSRIESGNFEIASAPYLFASILNDVVNVIRVRLAGKSIVFAVRVDGGIRGSLIGDEHRIRQILINILSNAVKYTPEGTITLSIESADTGGGTVLMTFKITDSGIGIRKQDIGHLFDDFVRLDLNRNRSVEGTGLGLAITRSLCLAMGGDIAVESTYGKGSVFTVTLPQRFADDTPLAAVENPEEKKVLFCCENPFYAESVLWALRTLGVNIFEAHGAEDFCVRLTDGEFQFAFVSPALLDQAADLVKRLNLQTRVVLLAGFDVPPSSEDISILMMPTYAVPVANVLNGAAAADWKRETNTRFVAPNAEVLVVDDNLVNLKIVQGLLKPYQIQVAVCKSGVQALSIAGRHRYDLVFMDHMMPEMDGIETTVCLRGIAEYRDVPIVALTANVISGMREMFLEKGMNDFLPKPIDPSKLDAMLRKWIPKDKQERTEQ
ncbi:MAG: response regulator [Synergistaceae bacterium]|nr:response regulator [Synergistaceae bacterium]